jgi:hypothetical protein
MVFPINGAATCASAAVRSAGTGRPLSRIVPGWRGSARAAA